MTNKRSYYEVLGVSKEATGDEIKTAYRQLAKKYHPDRAEANAVAKAEAELRFKECAEAYETLSNKEKRSRYDAGLSGPGPFGEPRYNGGKYPQQGEDIQLGVEISLEECFHGCTKTIEYDREVNCESCKGEGAKSGCTKVVCPHCKGTGVITQIGMNGRFRLDSICGGCMGTSWWTRPEDRCEACKGRGRSRRSERLDVRIPKGVMHRRGIGFPGYGHAGRYGGGFGDFGAVVLVKPHPQIERRGSDLARIMEISSILLAVGGTIEVQTFAGSKRLIVPAETPNGRVIKMAGMGLLEEVSGRQGDFYVKLMAETPKSLTEEQKQLLRSFLECERNKVEKTDDGKAIPVTEG